MSEERIKILEMLRLGKINADEALELLDALQGGRKPDASADTCDADTACDTSKKQEANPPEPPVPPIPPVPPVPPRTAGFKLPDIKMPEIKIPEVRIPEIKMPEIRIPEIKIPEIKIPEVVKEFEGGQYESINVKDICTYNGDVEADRMRITGVATFNGSVEADRVDIHGVATFRAGFKADRVDLSGVMTAFAGVDVDTLGINGVGEFKGELKADIIEMYGVMNARADINTDIFKSSGVLNAEGRLTADTVEIELRSENNVREIHADTVTVRLSRSTNPDGNGSGKLNCDVIEGDTVELENTRVRLVKGDNVRISVGCDIDRVEYTDQLEIAPGAAVKEQVMV